MKDHSPTLHVITLTTAITAMWLCSSCSTILEAIRDADVPAAIEDAIPEVPQTPPVVVPEPKPSEPISEPEPVTGWRTDVAEIQAVNGAVKFQTLDVTRPSKRNKDGGHEWIIARVNTDKGRVLIMVMSGDRPPSRIYSEAGGERLRVNAFPVPLSDVSEWLVVERKGGIEIELNGKVIDRRGGVGLKSATMNGYCNRESTGKWRTAE